MMLQPPLAQLRNISEHFNEHIKVVRQCLDELVGQIEAVTDIFLNGLDRGHKVIAFGNGGSATQASHLVGELLGKFSEPRKPYPAIALGSDSGVVTCIANDFGYEVLFERQVEALASTGDLVIGFTTSGRSENVRRGLEAASKHGAVAIALTGQDGLINGQAGHQLRVPSRNTALVQEVHLMILHHWCAQLDQQSKSGQGNLTE